MEKKPEPRQIVVEGHSGPTRKYMLPVGEVATSLVNKVKGVDSEVIRSERFGDSTAKKRAISERNIVLRYVQDHYAENREAYK